jgi:hypothetical protein
MTLVQARAKHVTVRQLIINGKDPAILKKQEKQRTKQRDSSTFKAVATEWYKIKSQPWVVGHQRRVWRYFEKDLFPWLGHQQLEDITAQDVLITVNRVKDRGANEIAHRCLNYVHTVYQYAQAHMLVNHDPTLPLKGALPPH